MPQMPAVIRIVYCYAREDEVLRNELEKHLQPLKRSGLIADWHAHQIQAGTEWERETEAHLQTANIILLLMSPDFIASDYCYSKQMRLALTRHETGDARVIPVILRSVHWQATPIGKLRALPADGTPITSWPDRDQAYLDVVKNIEEIVKTLFAQLQFVGNEVEHRNEEERNTSQSFLQVQDIVQRRFVIREQLEVERQRQKHLMISPTSAPVKIDKDIIISYDLDTQMGKFRDALNFGKACAFVLSGHSNILRRYILERMWQEICSKMRRECQKIDISLFSNDLKQDMHNVVQQKIVARCHCHTLMEVFESNPHVDVMLTIWNYGFPSGKMREAAICFWETVTEHILPTLERQSQCLIIIVANVDARMRGYSIDQFTFLSMPHKFAVEHLSRWFNGWLLKLGVQPHDIDQCLSRLQDQQGHFIATYDEMEAIISYLQGRYGEL